MAGIYDQITSGTRPVIITYAKTDVSKYSFIIDCTTNLTHSNNASVTSHPVEDGSSINDHAILDPRTLTLTGIVSDVPYTLYNFEFPFSTQDKASKKAYDIFQEIFNKKILVTIETDLEKYENMYIESMSFPRTKETQKSLNFTLNLKKVAFVTSEIANLPDGYYKEDIRSKATTKKITDVPLEEVKVKSNNNYGTILYNVGSV